MEDIEELGEHGADAIEASNIRKSLNVVSIKKFKKSVQQSQGEQLSHSDYFLPGQHSVFVKTWGCGHNNSDGEYMAGLLAAQGYDIILEDSRREFADVWLLNSCAVKGPSEQTFINDIRKAKDGGKKIVVAGCVPQGSPRGPEWRGLSVVGVQQIDRVVEVVEETLKGNVVRLLKEKKEDKRKLGGASLDLPKIRKNPFIEIIPINTGCLNQCTYCKTKHARGDLGSYPISEITARVDSVLSEGVLEIWLTSEDTGAYGRDIGTDIIKLLRAIIKTMDNHSLKNPNSKDAMLRVGMTNPPYILEHLDSIGEILRNPRVYSFLHVPVQCGSDKVLNSMRRMYTRQDFIRVVDVLKKDIPGISIATDIICGFPTETEDDFEETLSLLEMYRFPVIHISQFYPRPGTPAARMPRINTDIVKKRSRAVTKFFDSYFPYTNAMGSTLEVLVTERSSDGHSFVAHDKFYRQVLIEADDQIRIMGRKITVNVVEVYKWSVRGVLTDECRANLNQIENNVSMDEKSSEEQLANKRMPKLVRVQRKLVRMEDPRQLHDGMEDYGRDDDDDGAFLSLGTAGLEAIDDNCSECCGNGCCEENDSNLKKYSGLDQKVGVWCSYGIFMGIVMVAAIKLPIPVRWSAKLGGALIFVDINEKPESFSSVIFCLFSFPGMSITSSHSTDTTTFAIISDVIAALCIANTSASLLHQPLTIATIIRALLSFIPTYQTWFRCILQHDEFFNQNPCNISAMILNVARLCFMVGLSVSATATASIGIPFNAFMLFLLSSRAIHISTLILSIPATAFTKKVPLFIIGCKILENLIPLVFWAVCDSSDRMYRNMFLGVGCIFDVIGPFFLIVIEGRFCLPRYANSMSVRSNRFFGILGAALLFCLDTLFPVHPAYIYGQGFIQFDLILYSSSISILITIVSIVLIHMSLVVTNNSESTIIKNYISKQILMIVDLILSIFLMILVSSLSKVLRNLSNMHKIVTSLRIPGSNILVYDPITSFLGINVVLVDERDAVFTSLGVMLMIFCLLVFFNRSVATKRNMTEQVLKLSWKQDDKALPKIGLFLLIFGAILGNRFGNTGIPIGQWDCVVMAAIMGLAAILNQTMEILIFK
ncbi:Threonylcarbamoyladenosine tRNA methylthiotransferase [Nowakowskiella sp. JEL0078]|nr:Threonylcarbamoyladenosine tRNA methylthiotransferase [Nowakowskiella sp. JEL0078]